MKKFLSVLLMTAMLVAGLLPALSVSAATLPSFVVAENTEFDEQFDTVTVTFGIENNPGISELVVAVYYNSSELSIVESSFSDTIFDSEECIQGSTRNSNLKPFKGFVPSEFSRATEFSFCTSYNYDIGDYMNCAEDGTLMTICFKTEDKFTTGDEITYGIVVLSAINENGESIEFDGSVTGKVIAVSNPYADQYDGVVAYALPVTVSPDATTATVDVYLVNNSGLSTYRLFAAYAADGLSLNHIQFSDDVFTNAINMAGDEIDAAENQAFVNSAFQAGGVSPDGMRAVAFMQTLGLDKDNNYTRTEKNGLLARLIFDLPEGMQEGDEFEVLLLAGPFDFSVGYPGATAVENVPVNLVSTKITVKAAD